MNDGTQQDVLSLGEFKAHLTTWLSESADELLASDGQYKQGYLRVWIGGVECQLSGDSTRAGITDFLVAVETDDPDYFVVANKNGVVNRVVVGVYGDPISGFYLYTATALSEPTRLDEPTELPLGATSEHRAAEQPAGWQVPDLSQASARDIFTLQSRLMAELRNRGVLRTNNNPVADYSEWLVWKAIGSKPLEPNSAKSYDLETEEYGRVQVKARLVSSPVRRGQLQCSPFRSTGFDFAALVLLSDIDYSVVSAVLLPLDAAAEQWSWNNYVRGWRLHMNDKTMRHDRAHDITDLLRAAAELHGRDGCRAVR
ncbi:hypothetical protein [Janibacter melonis]|uniref:hypothetical protein n=1 Tax=Janibacter melonis TaxID=262209 RepID=UPI002094D29D|nr:hypothetical protein [Janibacter melonis]